MTRAKAMQIVEKLLKKDFKYLCKECRLKIYTLHLSFLMDSQTHNLQANLDFQENWVDVLCFISPTELTVGSESYWQALQTVNYVNWYTKAAGRFYIDTYGDLAYSLRIQYDMLENEPQMSVKEIEAAIDYYADLFIPFLNVCLGKENFDSAKQFIDDMYGGEVSGY